MLIDNQNDEHVNRVMEKTTIDNNMEKTMQKDNTHTTLMNHMEGRSTMQFIITTMRIPIDTEYSKFYTEIS